MGIGLGLLTFASLYSGLHEVGITWDEPLYFRSTRRIHFWVERLVSGPDRASLLREKAIRHTFDWRRRRNPHPPAYKLAMAATEAAFARSTGDLVGYRIAPLALFSLLVAGLTWLAGATWGLPAGLAAGLSLLLMPRLAGHAHIGASDMPLTAGWFAACAGLALYTVKGKRRHLVVGIAGLGFALATKFTGYLLPLAMLPWLVFYGRSRRGIGGAAVWGLGGLLVAYALDPLMWHGPIAEVLQLARDTLARKDWIPISTYYLGHAWGYRVPWHHVIVMTAITVPPSILLLAVCGTAAGARRLKEEPLIALGLVQIAFFVVLMAAPGSPEHDGVREWLAMFPFLALLAGPGFAAVLGFVRRHVPRRGLAPASIAAGALFFVPPAIEMVHVSPFYLSYYNALIGGPRGAARAGMEATYWLDSLTPSFLAQVGRVLPKGARVMLYPDPPQLPWLQKRGFLSKDVVVTKQMPADYILLVARKATFEPYHWHLYEDVRPMAAVELDGVELAGLYAVSPEEAPHPRPEGP